MQRRSPLTAFLTFQRHQNLDKLTNLKILSLQSNRITKIENLEKLENLEELYLSHNGVESMEGLEHNVSDSGMMQDMITEVAFQNKLKTLDIGANFIPAIENISHLTSLEELWVRLSLTRERTSS